MYMPRLDSGAYRANIIQIATDLLGALIGSPVILSLTLRDGREELYRLGRTEAELILADIAVGCREDVARARIIPAESTSRPQAPRAIWQWFGDTPQ